MSRGPRTEGKDDKSSSPGITDPEIREIRKLFTQLLELSSPEELDKIGAPVLLDLLQPESLLERFAAKKAVARAHPKDFLSVQGNLKGQIENKEAVFSSNNNDFVGFKCLHYSVTESNGKVEITIEKKTNQPDYTCGVRAV